MSDMFNSKINIGMTTTLSGIESNAAESKSINTSIGFEPAPEIEYTGRKRSIQHKPKILKEESIVDRNLNTSPVVPEATIKPSTEEVEKLFEVEATKVSLFNKLFRKRR